MSTYDMNVAAIGFFVLGLLAFCVLTFVSFRYLDEIESSLSGSLFVAGNRKLYLHAGVLGRIMRICTIATLLTTPRLFARRGLVNELQLQIFPRSLRRILVVAWCTMCGASIAFLALGYF